MQSLSKYLPTPFKRHAKKSKALKLIFQGFLFCGFLLSVFACDSSKTFAQNSYSYEYPIAPQRKEGEQADTFMRIRMKNSIALKKGEFNAIPISEFSGIAWDEDEQLLYAVSDEGYLFHLKLQFSKDTSKKLTSIQVVFATKLKNTVGSPLKGKYSDSEGLSLRNENNGKQGDSKLIVSFENKPRISEYSPSGKLIKNIKIQKRFRKRKTYRTKNKALESVTNHPVHGILTVAQLPIEGDDIKYQTLYATSKGAKELVWHFKASDAKNSSVTGLETLDDGSILILERVYRNPITPIIMSLRRLRLDKCNEKKECETEVIARFDGADGWLLDNFEGLAKLHGNELLVVSDDNKNPLQKTIFVHFEVLESNSEQEK